MAVLDKIQMCPGGPYFSRFVQGYWRMAEWRMSPEERLDFLRAHVDLGITTVDHAHVYGAPPCETLFGEALNLAPSMRDQIEIITKCGIEISRSGNSAHVNHYHTDRNSIIASVEQSLTRMGIDNIDVLLLHRPDLLMDVNEVADTFEDLKASGKVSYFGVSNFSNSQFSLLQSRLSMPLVTNQIEVNPINMGALEDGSLDFLQEKQRKPMAWSCLGGGRIFTEQSPEMTRARTVLAQVGEEVSADAIDQVLFAWVLALPAQAVPIIGSGNIERVTKSLRSLSLSLSREQWYRIWVAFKGRGVP